MHLQKQTETQTKFNKLLFLKIFGWKKKKKKNLDGQKVHSSLSRDVTENPNELFGQLNTKNAIQFYLNLHTIALGKKLSAVHLGMYWDSHIHLSFYKNWLQICTICSRWLETEKNQEVLLQQRQISLQNFCGFLGFPFFYFKKVTIPGSWYPAAGFSNVETVIFIFGLWLYPSHTAEMQKLLCSNPVVFIFAHSPAGEF